MGRRETKLSERHLHHPIDHRADNEEKALRLVTLLAAAGNVRTETLQAFTDKEFAKIVG